MERKDFLKSIGLAGAASLVPFKSVFAEGETAKTTACVLIPSETEGPYPLDLSTDASKFRTDVRESQTGVNLNLKLRIISTTDCLPIKNARVDIWHCNALGYYSGYTTTGQSGSQNHVGETWLRGIQMTDVDGIVNFKTIFPGWYSGRVTHIHFRIYLSSVLQVTSQLTFPVTEKNALYKANAPYSAYGDDPASLSTDMVFSDGYAVQMATLTASATAGEYDSYLDVAINAKSTGLITLEPETGGQFKLQQNFPNPYDTRTTVPFSLQTVSDVQLELFDMMGKKVAQIVQDRLPSGDHEIVVDTEALGMAKGNYLYQLSVTNDNGTFRQCKMMSAR